MSAKAALLEVLAGLEPDAANRDIDPATGTDRLARPLNVAAGVLYGWVGSEGYAVEGTGQMDRCEFVLRLAWGVAEQPAVSGGVRSRAVSDAVFARVEAIRGWVIGRRAGAAYEHLATTRVDHEAMTTDMVRAVVVDLSGYRLIT